MLKRHLDGMGIKLSSPNDLKFAAAGGFLIPVLTFLLINFFDFLDGRSSNFFADESDFEKYISVAPTSGLIWLIFYVGVVVPILEEILFRGFLWHLFELVTKSRDVAFVVTTVLFIAAHGTIKHMLGILTISVFMALIRYYTASISTTILAHMGNNIAVVLFMIFVIRFM